MASSSSRKTTLLWSPHASDAFAIGSPEHLKLYRFASDRQMHLLGGVADVQLKCAAWCPQASQPWTFAIGTASGRVVLHDCTPTEMRPGGGNGTATSALCEFVPRFQRVCYSAAWNPLNTNHVAAGLDKVRSDYGVLVWDISQHAASASGGGGVGGGGGVAGRALVPPLPRNSCRDFSSCVSYDLSSVGAVEAVAEPLAKLANSEAAVSVGWMPGAPTCLLTGTGT